MTLDPLVRRVRLPDRRELLVSDTVGFIDRLPHTLVAAFRATLEEVAEADLVLHVIDAASPERERHMAAVRSVLTEVEAAEVPRVHVYNKCDLLGPDELRRLQASDPQALFISARTGAGRDELLEAIAARLSLDVQRVTLEFDPRSDADRAQVARLYRDARVIQHIETDDRLAIEADVPRRVLDRHGACPPHGGDGVSRAAGHPGPGPLRGGGRLRAKGAGDDRRRRHGIRTSCSRPSQPPRRRPWPPIFSIAWSQLQAGNTGGADRTYDRVLKVAPGTAAALAGQGYVALARRDAERAVSRFDEALAVDSSLAAALVGKGQALLVLERPADALASFEAAQQADPQLALAPRIETLRFRVVEDSVEQARALAKSAAMGRRASGLRGGAAGVAGERRALSRAGRRRAPGRAVGRGGRAPGSRARTRPAGPRDADPAG